MEQIRVGIIGTGFTIGIAKSHYDAYQKCDKTTVTAFYDILPGRSQAFIEKHKIEGVKDDEAIVFLCDETTKPTTLRPEQDQEIAVKIFDEYYNLVEEANKEAAKNKKKSKK